MSDLREGWCEGDEFVSTINVSQLVPVFPLIPRDISLPYFVSYTYLG